MARHVTVSLPKSIGSPALENFTRQELEAEVVRLRSALIDAEQKANLTAIANDEARQRATAESGVELAIISTSPNGIVSDWNIGAERLFGWSAEQMTGRSIEKLLTPEDVADRMVDAQMQHALKVGRTSCERWYQHKHGEQFWGAGELSALYGDNESHIGYMWMLRDRTKEYVASRTVEETQQRYRLATKATNDAIWDWDLDTNQVTWNDALDTAYGHPLAEVGSTGDWWIEHIHPDDREHVHTSIHAVIHDGGTTWSGGYRFLRQDGTYADVLDRGQVIRDDKGRAVRMIGAMLDLTRMRAAEMALHQSQERFRTILETIDAAFAIVQVKFDADDRPVDYRFVEANPAFERHAGIDLRGKWVTEFAPDLEQFWFDVYGHVAKTGEAATFENYAHAFSRWFDVRALRVGDPADRQIAILFSDVTERRKAEERLKVSESLARENVERVQLALAAGAIIGTWNWDLPTNRFTVDEGFAQAFGLDPALGRTGLSLEQIIATVHTEDREGLIAAINEVISRGGAYAHQYRVRRTDGKYYWIEANGRVDHGEDGTPLNFPGVLIDVEDRRSIEAERDRATAALRALNDTLEQRVAERTSELIQAEDKLRQSQKMEAVGQLTGGLAHDFNNLLAGITGALELTRLRVAQGRVAEIDKYMIAAQGAAKRAAALTHRLLAFSRRQTLDPRPVDVNMLVADMIELIQRTVGPSIVVETANADGLWPAFVDASQLENATLNLCINSRDAMPDGGRITIETANHWLAGEEAAAHELPEGQYLSLRVTDTGTGMSPELIAKAFDPFFTTKPIGQGTGLGLSMIYGFAKQSGGQVRVDSEVGRGTSMCIYLPRYSGSVSTDAVEQSNQSTALAQAYGTILIVDDEPTVRLLLQDALGELGYTLIEACDSVSGLAALRSDKRIDLLITDVGLPGGMNGRQMADAGREVRPNLKTLFITGYAENAALEGSSLGPGMQILTKPFAIDNLVARVQNLLST